MNANRSWLLAAALLGAGTAQTFATPVPPAAADPAPPVTSALPPAEPSTPAPVDPPPDTVADVARRIDAERVPDNPAIEVLGAEDLTITRPGSVKDLATDVRALYVDGKIVPQIAIEVSPWNLTFGRRRSYREYLHHRSDQVLARLTLSLATTTAGSEELPATIGALGARVRLIDDSDWRLNTRAVDCALAQVELRPVSPTPPPNEGVHEAEAQSPAVDAKVAQCFAEHIRWNARQLAIGGAVSSAFPGSELRADIHDVAGWVSYADGYRRATRWTLGAKYLFNDVRPVAGALQPARHTVAGALQIEHRSPRFGIILSTSAGVRATDQIDDWATTWVGLAGGELQWPLGADTWASVRFSAELSGEGDQLISLANLKWNYDVSGKE